MIREMHSTQRGLNGRGCKTQKAGRGEHDKYSRGLKLDLDYSLTRYLLKDIMIWNSRSPREVGCHRDAVDWCSIPFRIAHA